MNIPAPQRPVVFAIGDSVMQGAGAELYATLPAVWPGIEVDAAPNRLLKHASPILRQRFSSGPAPEIVVVHLGTNGLFSGAEFDDVVDAATRATRLVFLTMKAPRDWESVVNERLANGVERYPARASLVDWHTIAGAHVEYVRRDGFHLSRIGAVAYAETIAGALRD